MSNVNLMKTTLSAIAMTAALTSTALADQVILKSQDGAIEVSGQLLASNPHAYVIRTAFGPLSVSKSRVKCVGEECLQEDGFDANLRILATGDMVQNLLPDALADMAMSDASTFDIRAAERGGFYGQFIPQDGADAEAMTFRVRPNDTQDALARLISGDADVVFATRSRAPAETAEGFTETHIGEQILTAVVHPDNPLSEIGLQQLTQIVTGQVTNWKEIGGPDADITLVYQADDAGMMHGFLSEGDENSLWLTCEEGSRITGFCYAIEETFAAGTWNMLALAVLPDRQGNGTGRAIVATLEKLLRDKKNRVLIADTSGTESFAGTRSFYERCGYTQEARIRDYWGSGDDKIVFWKAL